MYDWDDQVTKIEVNHEKVHAGEMKGACPILFAKLKGIKNRVKIWA
jgi:hypothetical protein